MSVGIAAVQLSAKSLEQPRPMHRFDNVMTITQQQDTNNAYFKSSSPHSISSENVQTTDKKSYNLLYRDGFCIAIPTNV